MDSQFLHILDVGKYFPQYFKLVSCCHSFMPFYSYLHQHPRMFLIQYYHNSQHIKTLKCPNNEYNSILIYIFLFFSNELRQGLKTVITFELEIIYGT